MTLEAAPFTELVVRSLTTVERHELHRRLVIVDFLRYSESWRHRTWLGSLDTPPLRYRYCGGIS